MPMTYTKDGSAPKRTHGISKTAIWVAAARAIGAREPDLRVRNPDHLAEILLGDPSQLDLKHPIVDALRGTYEAAMQDFEVAGMVRALTERARFIDEALERAIAAGASQVLVLGAGLDSHAYRFEKLLAHAQVFEVDRPATLDFKRSRVEAALGGAPANLTYVPVDLEHEQLSVALARHGYDTSQRTFIILEGVTMYVREEALRETFRYFASSASGSSVVFDFATRVMVEGLRNMDLTSIPPAARPSLQRFMDLISDEPWLFGIPLDGERQFLAEVGMELREVLTIGSKESAARYLTRVDGTTVGADAQAKTEALRQMMQAKANTLSPDERHTFKERMREQERQNAYRIAVAAVA
jgi:methyltransferase (TIGR00027 family)